MNKKVKNILLTVLFAFTVVLAGFVIVDALDNSNEGKITVNKTAIRDDGEAINETSGRKANVTLSVTGNEFTTSTSLDVVLVLDRSSSMHNNGSTKLSDAKSAAVELVNDLFANNTEDRTVVRMGVITFGKTVIDKWSNNTLSSNKNDVITKINAITSNDNDIPGNTNGQGTNVQSGLAKAKAVLANSTAKNKVVILLTDGAPSLFDYNGDILGTGNSDSEVCIEYTKEEVCYWGFCYDETVCAAKKKPSDAAKEEATALKDDDVTIYSVGFGVKENFYDSNDTKESKKNAREFLQAVATKAESPYYLLAENKDELSKSFDDIVKSISTIAKDVAVTDIVPAGFTVDETALKNNYGDKVSIAPGENGTTVITWNIGELSITEDPILTYQVRAKDDYYGAMYTNVSAVLTGTAVEGNPAYPDGEIEETFPLPEVAISKLTKNDNYTVKLGDILTVNTNKGILNNDSKIKVEDGEDTTVTDEIIITSASCGARSDIKVNADGSFEYNPSSTCYDGQTNKVVFEYVVKSTVTINSEAETVTSNVSTITINLTKDDSSLEDPTVTKTNNNGESTTSITGPFNYTIDYSTTVENHIGSTTITIVDTLPYQLDETKANDLANGTYEYKDGIATITWVETINNIDSYQNKNNDISIEKTITVYYKNVPTDVEVITNNVSVTTDIDNIPTEGTDETIVVRGNVVVEYVDNLGNTLLPSTTSEGLIDTPYTTSANNSIVTSGVEYQLVATKVNNTKVEKTNSYSGTYEEGTTTVTYVYYKVTGDIDTENTLLTKEGPEKVTSSASEFNYTINYSSKIDNYIGNATVTITDNLPLPIDQTKSDLNGGSYDAANQTITWIIPLNNINTYENGVYPINISKNIKVVFSGLDATERLLTNNVTAKLETSKSENEKETDEVTELEIKGTVIAHYVDTTGKTIADNKLQTGLVGNEYTTTAKTIDGYQLVRADGATTGTYIEGTIEVTYVYYKIEGTITGDTIIKNGTDEVDSVADSFEYEITYNATIKNYIGNATVTITDTLPLPIDEANSNLNGGTYKYENGVATITWIETITDIDTNTNGEYDVSITKNISVKYVGLEPTTREVTNTVIATIKTDIKEVTTEPAEKDTTVSVNGTVIAHYVDTTGATIATDEPQTGLVGNEYTTTAKTIDGYQLVDTVGKTTGTYIDGTIEVTYIYYRETGEIVGDTITKNGTDEVDSVTDNFEYEITYNATIKDYIGNATVTITDTLPLPIDEANSSLDDGTYKYENGVATITWTETITGIDTNANGAYNVEVTKNISVKYLGLDPTTRELTNTVIGTIETEVSEKNTEPTEKDTAVKVEGTVIAHYVDTTGKTIATDTTQTGLVGNEYRTNPETINGYQLVDTVGETTGTFIDGTIEVTYVYYKVEGNIADNTIIKTGTEEVNSVDATFEYTITYEAIIKGREIPNPGIPESFRVLQKELQALSIDVKLIDDNGEIMDTDDIMKETRSTPKYIREEFEDTRVDSSINDDFTFTNDGGDF